MRKAAEALNKGATAVSNSSASEVKDRYVSRMDKPTRSDSYPNSIRLSSTQ